MMPKMVGKMSAEDKRWQAECDARTLSEAMVIQKDKARLSAAASAAKKMMDDKMQEARAMKTIARKAPSKPARPAANSKKKY